jgi:hypothetical protein
MHLVAFLSNCLFHSVTDSVGIRVLQGQKREFFTFLVSSELRLSHSARAVIPANYIMIIFNLILFCPRPFWCIFRFDSYRLFAVEVISNTGT